MGQYVGRTIGLLPKQDEFLQKMANKNNQSVSEFVRDWVEGMRPVKATKNETPAKVSG